MHLGKAEVYSLYTASWNMRTMLHFDGFIKTRREVRKAKELWFKNKAKEAQKSRHSGKLGLAFGTFSIDGEARYLQGVQVKDEDRHICNTAESQEAR